MVNLFVTEVPDSPDVPADLLDWPFLSRESRTPTVRVLEEAGPHTIRRVLRHLVRGRVLSVVLVDGRLPAEKQWMLSEFHGRLVTAGGLADVGAYGMEGWRVVGQFGTFLVWEPTKAADVRPELRVVQSSAEFRHTLLSAEPTAIVVDSPELHVHDEELFGDLAGPGGGAAALLSLSGAWHDSASLVRNLAALELDDSRLIVGSVARLMADGVLSVCAVGLSGYSKLDEADVFRDQRAAMRVWAETDRSASQFWVLAEFSVSVDPQVVVPPGHIFEQQHLNGVQTLAASRGSSFELGPGESRTMAIPAWCLNHELSSPTGQPVSSTPLRCRYPATTSQDEVWRDRLRIKSGL